MPAAPFTVPDFTVVHGSIAGALVATHTSLDESYGLDAPEASAAIQAAIGAYSGVLADSDADPDVIATATQLCQEAADMMCLNRVDGKPDNDPLNYAARAMLLRARAIIGRDIATA